MEDDWFSFNTEAKLLIRMRKSFVVAFASNPNNPEQSYIYTSDGEYWVGAIDVKLLGSILK